MLSRFIINLRQVDTVASGMLAEVANERTSHFSDANFRMPSFGSIFDNLGEPIALGEEDGQNAETDTASTAMNPKSLQGPQRQPLGRRGLAGH